MSNVADGQQGAEETESLAWYLYPEPEGTGYDAQALSRPEKVQEVFDYCQIGLAVVWKEGWRFLFRTHGLAGILAINEQSEWFDIENREEGRQSLFYHCLIAGYDPTNDTFGTYDEETGLFTTTAGSTYEIAWSS